MTIPAAMPGPAPAANENPSCGISPAVDAPACCWPALPLVDGMDEEGLAVTVTLPSPSPLWAANHIRPSLSEVIHCMNEPGIGILASLLAPVLGSITAILSIVCSATHRLP